MSVPCPMCGRSIDLSARVTGDRIWCVCGTLLLLVFTLQGPKLTVEGMR